MSIHKMPVLEFVCIDCGTHVSKMVDDGYKEPRCAICRWIAEHPGLPQDMIDILRRREPRK